MLVYKLAALLLLVGCSYQPNCQQYCIGSDDAAFTLSTDLPDDADIKIINN